MVPSVVGEIAKLKGNATPNAIARWREIKAYEVSATELFGAGKSTQRGDVHHLQFGLHPTGAGTFSLFFLCPSFTGTSATKGRKGPAQDSDIVIDDNGFVLIPGEYEHDFSFRGMR